MNKNLEIGTEVRVREDLVADQFYGGLRFHNGMTRFKGETFTIFGSPHYNENAYGLEGTGGYDWSVEMLEIIK